MCSCVYFVAVVVNQGSLRSFFVFSFIFPSAVLVISISTTTAIIDDIANHHFGCTFATFPLLLPAHRHRNGQTDTQLHIQTNTKFLRDDRSHRPVVDWATKKKKKEVSKLMIYTDCFCLFSHRTSITLLMAALPVHSTIPPSFPLSIYN